MAGSLTRSISAKLLQMSLKREQEGIQSLIEHSQATLDAGEELVEEGFTTTIRTAGIQDERLNEGRETVIPTFWKGRLFDIRIPEEREQVVQFALQSGRKWPSADKDNLHEANVIDEFAHQAIRKQTRRN